MMYRQAESSEKESDRKGGNKMKTYDVVGIGDLCLDITAGVPKIPETDMAQRLLFQTLLPCLWRPPHQPLLFQRLS